MNPAEETTARQDCQKDAILSHRVQAIEHREVVGRIAAKISALAAQTDRGEDEAWHTVVEKAGVE